jgi:hypothetical protein
VDHEGAALTCAAVLPARFAGLVVRCAFSSIVLSARRPHMADDVDNSQDVLDIRDVIERFEELKAEQESLVGDYLNSKDGSEDRDNAINALSSFWNCTPEEVPGGVEAIEEDNGTDSFKGEPELAALRDFLHEMRGNGGDHQWEGDWYPVTLIRESYFEDYAQELAEDIGAISRDAQWPLSYIDWPRAAEALKMDYTGAEFDGVTYYFR